MRNLLLLTAALTGCVYDADDRCGPYMTYSASLDACLCEDNAIASGGGCTPCAADEVVVSGACACPAGSAKNAENVCEEVAGLGDTCATSADCTDATYDTCAPETAGTATSGTCTRTCATDDDCGATYTCATWEAQPYCRLFAGVGKSCNTSDDCAGTDAPMCDTFQSHTCIVAGCSLDDQDCPRGTACCDFSSYGLGTLCAPEGSCP